MRDYLLQRFNFEARCYEFLSTNGVDFFIPAEWSENTPPYKPHFFTLDDAIEWMHRIPNTSVTNEYNWY